MSVLIAVASKHGATAEIAEEIGETLKAVGVGATVVDARADVDLSGYDAVLVGSAVYAGRWQKDAIAFINDHHDWLARLPVWMFSSGPIGEDAEPDPVSLDLEELADSIHARQHVVFAGKLDKSSLGFAERAVATALRAPEGDFRDWDAIREFARVVAGALKESDRAEA